MSRVNIADLKARLSRHLRTVRRGGSITVLDRETPIARIVPMDTEVSGLVIHLPKEPKGRLDGVAQPMPTQLGTLDAIHLATVLLWRDASAEQPTMATHDVALGVAARAHGLPVVGI